MRPEEIETLLGGYATGTLTGQERDALFRAALANQELFNAIADEQALKELLDDPASRRELLEALAETKRPFFQRFRMWMGRPASWAVAGSMAAAVLAAVILIRVHSPAPAPEAPVELAKQAAPPPVLSAPRSNPRSISEPRKELPAAKTPAQPAETPQPSTKLEEAKQSASELPAETREKETAGAAFRAPASGVVGGILSDTAAVSPLGLRYTILRAGPSDNFEKADAQMVFHGGDQIRLAVEPNSSGYLSVALQDAQGAREVLFGNPVEAQRTYLIPPTVPLRLESPPGEIKFLVTLSRGPERPRAAGTLVKSLKEKEAAGRKAAASYVADKPADPNAPVSVEIPIHYR